jgi:hypothetical protein
MSNTENEKTPLASGATTPRGNAAPAGVNTGQLSDRLRSLKRKEPNAGNSGNSGNSSSSSAASRARYAKSKQEQVVWYEDPEKGEAVMEKSAKPAANTFAEPDLFDANVSPVSVASMASKGGRSRSRSRSRKTKRAARKSRKSRKSRKGRLGHRRR